MLYLTLLCKGKAIFKLKKLLTANHFLILSQINAHLKIRALNREFMRGNKEISLFSPGNIDYLIIFVG